MDSSSVVVITNLPKVPEAKVEKLTKVVIKLVSKIGTLNSDLDMPFDEEEGSTLGFGLVEYETPKEAKNAVEVLEGYKFDKDHPLGMSLYSHALKKKKLKDTSFEETNCCSALRHCCGSGCCGSVLTLLKCLRIAYLFEVLQQTLGWTPLVVQHARRQLSNKNAKELVSLASKLPEAPYEQRLCKIDNDVLAKACALLESVTSCKCENHPDDLQSLDQLMENERKRNPRVAQGIQQMEIIWQASNLNSLLASFPVPHQKGGTCYANACAAAIFLANSRVVGRPKLGFEDLREILIKGFGTDGASIKKVLPKALEFNIGGKLRYEKVNEEEARDILSKKGHPLIATFRLFEDQWDQFTRFFRSYPTGTMTRGVIRGRLPEYTDVADGHAVLATEVTKRGSLVLLNSWGNNWGYNGFFRVKNAAILGLQFYHVYFLESDLSEHERQAYRSRVNSIYWKFMIGRPFGRCKKEFTQWLTRMREGSTSKNAPDAGIEETDSESSDSDAGETFDNY